MYRLTWRSSSTKSLDVMSRTGLASTLDADGSGRLLTYFQDPQGRIIENSYLDGKWSLEDRANIDHSVVTTQAAYGSQLAAISYPLDGKMYRQVFFVTSTGAVMTANSSTTSDGIATDWSISRSITNDRIDPKSIGLAACWSDKAMNGIRVFYPSQYGYVQEQIYTFGSQGWTDGQQMDASDSQSGIGCAVALSNSEEYLNLYFRSTASGKVKQTWYDYLANNKNYQYTSKKTRFYLRAWHEG